jgi:hypothetical protein
MDKDLEMGQLRGTIRELGHKIDNMERESNKVIDI